jgi:hypothetical protein
MAKRNKTKKLKRRNIIAVAARSRSGAGRHPNRKKMANKRACRGKASE